MGATLGRIWGEGVESPFKARLVPADLSDRASNYRLCEKLGHGTFGIVYRAIHVATKQEVAIKQIRKAGKIKSLQREIEIMGKVQKLQNEHLIQMQGVYEDDLHINIIMELASGGELFNRIEQAETFTELEARSAVSQVLNGVAALHSVEILHLDIKPQNLIYAKEGGSLLKLTDFGTSIVFSDLQKHNRLVGTISYMAPEVVAHRYYSEAADVWAIGVILFVLLVGYVPLAPRSTSAGRIRSQMQRLTEVKEANVVYQADHWKDISNEAKDLVQKILQKDPQKRLTISQILDHAWFSSMDESTMQTPLVESHTRFIDYNAKRKFRTAVKATLLGLQLVRFSATSSGNNDWKFGAGDNVKVVKFGKQEGNTAVVVDAQWREGLVKVEMTCGASMGQIKAYNEGELELVASAGRAAADGAGNSGTSASTGKRKRGAEGRAARAVTKAGQAEDGQGEGRAAKRTVRLGASDLSELREIFDFYDQNSDGLLCSVEIKQMVMSLGTAENLTYAQVQDVVRKLDINGDGGVSFEEFVPVVEEAKSRYGKKELLEAFKIFDKDGDGQMSRVELQDFFESGLGMEIDEEEFALMLEAADTNGDGHIDFQEFVDLVLPTSVSQPGAE